MSYKALTAAAALAFCLASPAHAAWDYNGSAVSQAPSTQLPTDMVASGTGPAFVVWDDRREDSHYDLYIQRIDPDGTMAWLHNGTGVITVAGDQRYARLLPDGTGGVYVVWQDTRSGSSDIYAQRFNSSGSSQWTNTGVAVCTASSGQTHPRLTTDGVGGIIVVWVDYRSGNPELYAQRLDSSGARVWAFNGVNIAPGVSSFYAPEVVSDGAAGAIVVSSWFFTGNSDVYAQRIDKNGAPLWGLGVSVCTAANDQVLSHVVEDGLNGAIAVWQDVRSTNYDVYAQRIGPTGAMVWPLDGLAVCDESGDQFPGGVVADGSGGAFLCWSDRRVSDSDVYGQRIDASGQWLWPENGRAICALSPSFQQSPRALADGNGGYVVTWEDNRGGTYDIFAQRINGMGDPLWDADGVPLLQAGGGQFDVFLTPADDGGAILVWRDERAGTSEDDVFAQRVEFRHGGWGWPEPVVTSAEDVPGDQGGTVAVNWMASGHDGLNFREVTHYSVWRAVDAVTATAAPVRGGAAGTRLVTPADITPDFCGDAVYRDTRAGVDYYWEWVANQTAHYLPAYSYLAPTRNDSTASNPAVHQFMVMAHTADVYVSWPSNAVPGYSVDDLSPASPNNLVAERVDDDVRLDWRMNTESDFAEYIVYRASSPGVTPEPMYFISTSMDTVLWDTDAAPNAAWYYIVTAADIHGNESAPSNEAMVEGTATGIGDTPALTHLRVRANVPNPFSRTTAFEVGLPAAGNITVAVFDVAGRRVATRHAPGSQGWQRVPFDGRNDTGRLLPSGVYFYRVQAGGETVTRKMVLHR